MDKLDKEILKILSQNGRTSFKQISEAVGLTSPAVKTRIEKMEKVLFYVAAALIAVMVLTLWVNIIVAITKKVVAWDKFPVQVWVMIVAIASTLITAAAFAQYFNIAMLWYYWVAAIALGFLVCYAAMFGYDNLYKQIMETVQKIRELLAGITKDAE